MTEAKTLNEAHLKQFTGTENRYRLPKVQEVLYTDGAKYVAETGDAFWLLDEIAFAQTHKRIACEPFQLWTLKVNLTESTAILICEDGDDFLVTQKHILFTDFPLKEISFYFTGNVIMLPDEY